MHTIKNKVENQIIHFNPDLSGNVNIICKGKNKELVADLEIDGDLLKNLFLNNISQIIENGNCLSKQRFSDCHIHNDSQFGCLDCGNFSYR